MTERISPEIAGMDLKVAGETFAKLMDECERLRAQVERLRTAAQAADHAAEIDRLHEMLGDREEFIANNGLWKEFSAYLAEPRTEPQAAPDVPAYADPNFRYNEKTRSYHRITEPQEAPLTDDELFTLTCLIEHLRSVVDPDDTDGKSRRAEAAFRYASKLAAIIKRAPLSRPQRPEDSK